MKIKRKISQHRRDFWADYECEFCGHVDKHQSGYDDSFFHNNVIPKMKCTECGKASNEVTSSPKYNDSVVL